MIFKGFNMDINCILRELDLLYPTFTDDEKYWLEADNKMNSTLKDGEKSWLKADKMNRLYNENEEKRQRKIATLEYELKLEIAETKKKIKQAKLIGFFLNWPTSLGIFLTAIFILCMILFWLFNVLFDFDYENNAILWTIHKDWGAFSFAVAVLGGLLSIGIFLGAVAGYAWGVFKILEKIEILKEKYGTDHAEELKTKLAVLEKDLCLKEYERENYNKGEYLDNALGTDLAAEYRKIKGIKQ